MSNSVLDPEDFSTLEYIITHVFCPLQLPDGDDHSVDNDYSLAAAAITAAQLYMTQAGVPPIWHSVLQTLDNLLVIVQFQSLDMSETISQLASMDAGDVLAFMIRAQNAAVIFRRHKSVTIFESFELSPKAEDVMTTQGKLVRSFPGPAMQVPNTVFDEEDFLSQLANFLVHMNDDVLPDAAATAQKAQSTVLEARDTTHPRYITELLTGILRSVGCPSNVARITKRIGDDVVWNNSKLPWRRSSLWLLIRVVLQTTLDRSSLGRGAYKEFMLFFMCCIGKERMCRDLSNDILQSITAKISRRLQKLGTSAPGWLSHIALRTCTSLRSILEKRWEQIQALQCLSLPWDPSALDPWQDTQLSLKSGDYICARLADHGIDPICTNFGPRHRRRGCLSDFLSSDGAFFKEAYGAESHVTLYDLEQAIEQGIDGWVDGVTDNDDACVKLEILANKYSSSALTSYKNNPELLSVMLLTVIELWVALDKIVIKEIPVLAEYSPEIPTTLLEDLLLCKATSLHRLRLAHQYISRRHSQSNCGSVFSSKATANSFPVRYFRGSPHLQHLKTQIEEAAQRDVDKKVAQLEKANARHAKLKQRCINTEHSSSVNQDGREFHPKKCTRCCLEMQLSRMNINVHEWPLPPGNMADVVLFELDCPISFNMWRNATLHLLVDLCSPSLKPKDPYITLNQYGALKPYLVRHPRSRISLGSDTKPFVVTHYSKVSIPATQKQVCINNGLSFSGFDCQARIPVSEALGRINVNNYCTHRLQSGPYQNLQKYVSSASHTSNEVMANQFDCHKDLSIHEFVAFAHLRSGGSLQWLSILRELRGRSLTFRHHEVHSLIAQAVSQVGPLADAEWMWHQEIKQPSFCKALVEELESLLGDVKANWLEVVTMSTISFLLCRLLASLPTQPISRKAFRLLRAIRVRVFSWVIELSNKLSESYEDVELHGLLRDTAAICRSTFDVEPSMIREVLSSSEDVEILLASSMLILDNAPSKISSLHPHSQLLLDRDRRLSMALEGVLSDIIQTPIGNHGVDLAVAKVWPFYRPGSKWIPLEHPNSRWLSCTTAPAASQCSQRVHLNLLDGSLLVDGKPLGRLPHKILQSPLYTQIFAKQILDVVPAALPGMDYSTRDVVSGHRVFFSLGDDHLIIRAKPADASDSEMLELIPPEKLAGDLPAVLIDGHAHWLNISTSVLEIRPLNRLWEASSENWVIDCTPGQYHIHRGREFLVSIHSPSWAMVSGRLGPLETPQNLLVTYSPADSQGQSSPLLRLTVALPRYALSFFVDEDGDLQSYNIRNMIYDENQSIGTMFGLVNKLVLRPKPRSVAADELVSRCVLIPEGDISFQRDGQHVRVEVDTQDHLRISYQTYRIDTDLGCLTGNVSLTNKLYCAYLHALTSGCSIDPLTGRLGTEEALSLLRSANCWSIMRLSPRDAKLLGLIASLCPSRTWYPKQLTCMQKVEWNDLPTSAQHHELYLLANGIKEHCERLQSLHESQPGTLFEVFPVREYCLLQRSALRAAYLFPPEFSGVPSDRIDYDVRYLGRDIVDSDSGEHRAYTAANIIHHTAGDAAGAESIKNIMDSWKDVSVARSAPLSLRYDRSWLNPNLPSIWLTAYNLLRENDERKWTQLLFSLPAMAYASPTISNLVPVFVAFATVDDFRLEDPPNYDSYDLSDGYCLSPNILRAHVARYAYPFERSPESTEPAKSGESPNALCKRQRGLYRNRLQSDIDATIRQSLDAWPETPQCRLDPDLYDVASVALDIENYFSSCHRNLKLRQHLTRVQNILKGVSSQVIPNLQYLFHPSQHIPSRTSWCPTAQQLLTGPPPTIPGYIELARYSVASQNTLSPNSAPLRQLIAKVATSGTSLFQVRYASALRTSTASLEKEKPQSATEKHQEPASKPLEMRYAKCKARYVEVMRLFKQSLGPKGDGERAIYLSGQWPRITPHALFRILASNSQIILDDNWKECLIKLAILVLELQRTRRLLRLFLDGLHEDFFKESENEGCDGWIAEEHPDWLLIQLQGNLLIRRVQADVANEMISPCSSKNTAMQLNMGEGKSSVIVPISAATLADGDQVVRVIVPKALTSQMFQLLVDRLGGLANRRIYFLPFTRSIEVTPERIATLREVMSECMINQGILVVQPEHVLSLKLVTVEKQLLHAQDAVVSSQLLDLQRWVHSRSRDILDESDEILHVRYELVYTIGNQQPMEGFPDRWTTTQQILGLVNKHTPLLRGCFPLGVECEHGPPGSFSCLRILQVDTGRELISWLVRDVMDGHLSNFTFRQLRSDLRDAIRSFITDERVSHAQMRLVEEFARESPLWGGLLLLRGLLVTGILLFAFRERRWRVDYGLALTLTMLAVPYRAKDVPAQRAEFGHPDVAIILTCLSYYYGGLNEEQLKASFELLLKQDDPSVDYELWIRACSSVPESLQSLSGINLKSSEQWRKVLLPLFSRNKATIDFYLSRVVFPREAKEFPFKLSCSGWDLAEERDRLLTGFSGTNDGRYLLPLHITQRDPDHQRGTNARVLAYLLQPENNHYLCTTLQGGTRQTTGQFLDVLARERPEIRVLLDVGAQMLDLQNRALAEAWLAVSPNSSAAIYFSEDDELTVLTRDGSTQLFLSSPFAQQLDQCVVYLDDVHTRGTDINFPSNFRAAVTLGPGITKDRLAQGCMRMRKLGHGHSVMFFAPLEVDRRIRHVTGKTPSSDIGAMDILQWAIQETCDDVQLRVPHWAQQGMNHALRYDVWSRFSSGKLSSTQLEFVWLQPEAKMLENLYGLRDKSKSTVLMSPDMHRRCTELGVLAFAHALNLDEEHEREVVHEAERERQVERPPKVPPAAHSVHPDVVRFVNTGVILQNSKAFRPAFSSLDKTSAAAREAHVWSPSILVTTDFESTVNSSKEVGEYLRPVQWVVSGKRAQKDVLVILSPYEAEHLMPDIRTSKHVRLHVYTPRVFKSMKPCDDLALYSLPAVRTGWTAPALLMDQLGLFAGQLYLKDYETYVRLRRFLCVYAGDLGGNDFEMGSDGLIVPRNRPRQLQTTGAHTFQTSPLNSLKVLVGLRRKGMQFAPTHMGKLLDGLVLSESDF